MSIVKSGYFIQENILSSLVSCNMSFINMFVLSGSQELSQLSNAAGLVSGGNSAPEITLTINNSSLTQALAQTSAAASTPAISTPEITLTIAGTHTPLQTIQTQTSALSVDFADLLKSQW